jgi:regulator of sigma E protease
MFILIFILTLLVLVVIHELGHYFAAKKFNIRPLEFGFGLPPRIWGKQIGETLWSLNWLPFGGFVRLAGEDDVEEDVPKNRQFSTANVWKRIIVVVAGVFMNLLLAWVLFYVVLAAQNFKAQVPLLAPHQFIGVNQVNEEMVVIGQVSPGSPAEQAGVQGGERVLSFNGQPVQTAEELVSKTKENAGQAITLTVSDNPEGSNPKEVTLTPRVSPPPGQGALGVSLGSLAVATLNYETPVQKVFSGPVHSFNLVVYSGQILGQTISTAFIRKDIAPVSQTVAGPVGITALVKQILDIKNPLIPYLNFVAAISLNLALVNVLPFPGLDGGRLFFLLIEAIFRKRIHPNIERYIHTVGFAILLAMIILVTFSDIKKFI